MSDTLILLLTLGSALATPFVLRGDAVTERMSLPGSIFDFERSSDLEGWYPLDDRVMGGISKSEFRSTGKGTAAFRGVVSLENNGGFASVRSPAADYGLGGFDSLRMRVKGDGNVYKLCLKTDDAWDGILYQAEFRTREGEWVEVTLPFRSFQPRWRGRLVPQAGPLSPDKVRTFGFMISNKQAGPFRLEVDWMRAEEYER